MDIVLICYFIFFMYTTGMVTANQIGTRPTSSKHLRPSSRPLEPVERKGTEFQRLIYMYMYAYMYSIYLQLHIIPYFEKFSW